MTTETIKFKIELYAEYWDKAPMVDVCINGTSKFKELITDTEQNPKIIEFEHDFIEGDAYKLVINKSNKDLSQTVVENGNIVKDQLVYIKSINIDAVDLGGLLYDGAYYPTYPEPWATQQRAEGKDLPESYKNVTSMGHDGRWELAMTSPFYMWLLENLY